MSFRVTPCCWVFFPVSRSLWRDLAGLNREFLSPWLSKWLPLLFPLCLEDLGDPRREGRCHTSTRCALHFPCMCFACDGSVSCCQKISACLECRGGAWKGSWAPSLSAQGWGQEYMVLRREEVMLEQSPLTGPGCMLITDPSSQFEAWTLHGHFLLPTSSGRAHLSKPGASHMS